MLRPPSGRTARGSAAGMWVRPASFGARTCPVGDDLPEHARSVPGGVIIAPIPGRIQEDRPFSVSFPPSLHSPAPGNSRNPISGRNQIAVSWKIIFSHGRRHNHQFLRMAAKAPVKNDHPAPAGTHIHKLSASLQNTWPMKCFQRPIDRVNVFSRTLVDIVHRVNVPFPDSMSEMQSARGWIQTLHTDFECRTECMAPDWMPVW